MRRDILASLVGYTIPPVLAFATQVLLARGLGVDDRGLVAGAIAPMMLLTLVATLGLPESVTHHLALHGRSPVMRVAVRRAFLTLLVVGVLTTSLWILFQLSARGPGIARDASIIAICATTPLLLMYGMRGVAAGEHQWRLVAAERILGAILQLGVVISFLLSNELSVVSATGALAFAQVVAAAVYLVLIRGNQSAPGNSAVEDAAIHHYGLRLWAGTLAGVLLIRLDQVLIAPLSNAHELGIYAVAVPLSEGVLLINGALRDVLFARQSHNPDLDQLAFGARVSTSATLIAALTVGTASIWLVPLIFGKDYTHSVPVLALLLAASTLGNPGSIAAMGLSARGRPELRSMCLVAAAVVNVAAMLVLVPPWGAVGAAAACVVSYPISGWLGLILLKRMSQIQVMDFVLLKRSDIPSLLQSIPLRVTRIR